MATAKPKGAAKPKVRGARQRLLDDAREYLDRYIRRRDTGAGPIIQRAA